MGANNLMLGDYQWTPMIMNASRCKWCEWHKVRSIAMQHGQDFLFPRRSRWKDNFADCEAWSGGCHSWPRQNTKVIGLPCIWGNRPKHKLDKKAFGDDIIGWKRHGRQKLGCEGIVSCHLPRSRSTTRWLDGTCAWGPTLVLAAQAFWWGSGKMRYAVHWKHA